MEADPSPDAGRAPLAHRQTGEGEPIVLLHGVPGQASVWAATTDLLARDFHVVSVDLAGFGDSPDPDRRTDLLPGPQATAVVAVLDELDLHDVTLVGHDLGGAVAVLLAHEHPDRVGRLGLVAADVLADSPPPVSLSFLRWPVLGRVLERTLFGHRTLRRMVGQMAARGDGATVDVDEWVGDKRRSADTRWLIVELLRRRREHLGAATDALGDLDLPAAVVWGGDDPVSRPSTAKRIAVRLPRGRHTVIEGAGHLLPVESPDGVAHALRDLIARPRGA